MSRQICILAAESGLPPSVIREEYTSEDMVEMIAHSNSYLPPYWYAMACMASPIVNAISGAKTEPKDFIPNIRPKPAMTEEQMRANMALWR